MAHLHSTSQRTVRRSQHRLLLRPVQSPSFHKAAEGHSRRGSPLRGLGRQLVRKPAIRQLNAIVGHRRASPRPNPETETEKNI